MKILSSLAYIAKYILIGLGFAALLVLLLPNRFGLSLHKVSEQETSQTAIDIPQMLEKAKSAVVTLQVQSKAYPINSKLCFDNVKTHGSAQNACRFYNNGSGVIINGEGHLVTSAHVITFSSRGQTFDKAETILVEFSNGQKTTAQIIGFDLESDIALLKVEASNTPFLSLKMPNTSQVGDTVYAIGTPYFGFNQTVTSGIISAKFFAKVSNYLQVDAALRSGNSGGALIDQEGNLIGITQLSSQEVSGAKILQNFAVAASDVKSIVEQIQQSGKVSRGWLGLNGERVSNIDAILSRSQLTPNEISQIKKELRNIPAGQGIVVTGVNKNGPAELAGLQVLDVVTQVNEQPIYTSSDLLSAIWNKQPDEKVKVTYWRNGQETQTEVVLGSKG